MGTLIAVHGDSGHGKTGICGSFSEWLQEKYPGTKARLITADNIDVVEPHIHAGLIDVWQIPLWDHPFEAINYASQGYWPQDTSNPKSKLLPPTAATWQSVRLLMFEGLSHFSDMLMKHLGDLGGEGKSIGPGTRTGKGDGEKADLINFQDGDYGVGGNSMSHYNITQKEMRKYILASSVLPIPCLWTAHTIKATEDNKPIYGPQLAGKAATAKVQSWFSALLHAHVQPQGSALSYRLYLKEHVDTKNCGPIPFKAIQRIPLPLLDPKLKQTIENKWNEIVPEYIEWTNDSRIAHKYMAIREKMLDATRELLLRAKEEKNAS